MNIIARIISKETWSKHLPLLVLILLSFILIVYFYAPVLFHPSQYLLNNGGDAIKNYFCYEWHIQNDSSLIDYSGSNYPYGENHLYTDGTPILSNLIRLLPFFKSYSIAIFNLSMLLSLTVCAILLYKIFELFNIPKWYAVLSALGIMVLCPQSLRYTGHFALSYGFCIPLIIYLLLKYELASDNYRRRSAVISFTTLCVLFIHPYLGMISTSFIVFYWLFKMMFDLKNIKLYIFHFLIQGVFPLLFYFVLVKLTDTHTDRVAKPYGFFYLISSIETIFISTHKPFRHLLSQLYKIKIQNGEGIAYVGITSLVCLFYLPFLLFKKKDQLREHIRTVIPVRTILYMFLSAVVLLLFSMGYPFKWNMNWILDYVPVLQQFRSPGRFAWAFYFIVSIGSCIVICKYFLIKLNPYLRVILICSLLLLYTVEGIPYHNEVAKKEYPLNCFKEELLTDELRSVINVIKTANAQAIIPLPFFHIGTDYYDVSGTSAIRDLAFIVTYHANTPLMANLTPRNSISEAKKLIQILGSDMINKGIKNDIKSSKPFIILYNKEQLQEEELFLLSKGVTLLETPNFIVKEISPEKLFYNSASSKISYFKSNHNALYKHNDFYMSDSAYFQFLNFDKLPGQHYTANVNDINTLVEIPSNVLQNGMTYEVSFWYKTKEKLDMNNLLCVLELFPDGHTEVIAQKNVNAMFNVDDEKTLAKLVFKTEHPENNIMVTLNGKSDREKVFYVDDLMIRRKDTDVYKLSYSADYKDSVLTVNNIELQFKNNK